MRRVRAYWGRFALLTVLVVAAFFVAVAPAGGQGWAPVGGSGGGASKGPAFFSIVDFAVSLNASTSNDGGENFTAPNGNFTPGGAFAVTDNGTTHTLTGVRTFWAGHLTTLKATVWKSFGVGGGGVAKLQGSATLGVTNAQGVITIPLTPITLVPGLTYVMGVYDMIAYEGGTPQQTIIGTSNNSTWQMFNGQGRFQGGSWWIYVLPPGNGGSGFGSPFDLYGNGDAPPFNQTSTNWLIVEPVLVY